MNTCFLFIHFQVLFGVVASLDKHSTHSFGATQRPSSGSHDQHNVMPLAPNPPRFTLLPLSFHLSPEIGAQTADLTRKMVSERISLTTVRLICMINCFIC